MLVEKLENFAVVLGYFLLRRYKRKYGTFLQSSKAVLTDRSDGRKNSHFLKRLEMQTYLRAEYLVRRMQFITAY